MNSAELIEKLIELRESKSTEDNKEHSYSKTQKKRRFLFALWKRKPWR